MNDTSRLFTALILSALAIFAYNYFFIQPKMQKAKEGQALIEKSVSSGQSVNQQINSDFSNEVDSKKIDVKTGFEKSVGKLEKRSNLIKKGFSENSRIKIITPKLHGSINLKGAVLDDLTLANYHVELDKKSPEVTLLSPKNTKELYFLRTGWVAAEEGITLPTENDIWINEGNQKLGIESNVKISWQSPEGIVFKKIISIDENYLITVKELVENNAKNSITLLPFGLVNRARAVSEEFYISHEGPVALVDNVLNEVTYKDLVDEEKKSFEKVSGWAAIADKYWLTALLPQDLNTQKFDINFSYYNKNGQNRYQVDLLAGEYEIGQGQKLTYTFKIYAGAKQLSLLDKYSKSENANLFDRTIDFGSLYFLTKPIFKALTYFNSHIGNFGLAILLLTIVIRLILFPLANKSYKSMAMMKKHAPDIEKIKEKHKGDRQKLSQEIMKYYKDHKINPMSGCLPMLIQIPVFFALYKVLYVTIEMRHAPFYGYITDLSVKDPTNIFNLFGLLNYTPPAFLPAIGILPILYAVSLFLQQKLSPPAGDETQRLVISFMPWILLFVFAGFPTGLVLYWVWNNILSIAQQYIITRKIEADKNA